MVLWKFIRREIKNRPGRATLTLLSIVIGVAAVVSVNIATNTTRAAYQEMYESLTGRAALEVVAEGGGFFDQAVLPDVEQVPGVRAAVPVMEQFVLLYNKDNRVRLLCMGVDPKRDEAVRQYDLKEGAFLQPGDQGVVMEQGFAHGLGVQVGDEIKLLVYPKPQLVKILGLLSPRGAAGFGQGGIMFMPLAMAQRFYRHPRQISSISVVLSDDANEQQVQEAIAERLPTGLTVRTSAMRTPVSREIMQTAEQGLNFSYALMVVLAVVMILNTFLMNVGERRRQFAILRAIGATRLQIMAMLLTEGLVMGLAGTAIGTVFGLVGAYAITGAMSQAMSAAIPAIRVTAGALLIAVAIGPGMSLLAMYIPARIAGRVSPLEGMRPAVSEPASRVPIWFTVAGLGMFFVTGLLLAGAIYGYLPVWLSIPGGVLFTAAFVPLIAPVLRVLAGAVSWVLSPLLGTEGRIACRQIVRRRGRTTLTIGVLYISIGSGIALGTAIINNVNDMHTWLRRTLPGDFFIRATFSDAGSGQAVHMDDAIGQEAGKIPGVTSVDTIRGISANVDDQQATVLVHEFSDPDELPLYLNEGNEKDIRAKLFAGEAVIGSTLAKRLNKGVGDEVTLATREGPRNVKIAATVTEYLVGGGLVLHLERSVAKRMFDVQGVDMFLIKSAPKSLAEVQAQLKSICDQQGLMLLAFADLRRRLDMLSNGIIASLWGLMAMGFVVSAFGVANTLAMNVLEQTRELALLRVVAMRRAQVRKTVLSQAALMGTIGLATGSIGGLVGAMITNLTSIPLLGYAVPFRWHPVLIWGSIGVAVAIVLSAALVPAERAARLNLLIALQYE